MPKVYAVITEAEPGLVHITLDALDELLTEVGWRKIETGSAGTRQYVRALPHTARPPHPDTQIGRK